MTIWDQLRAIFKSEANDVGEGLSAAHDKLDQVLTQKERELNATPTERMGMVLDDIAESDDRFDAIVDRAEGRGATARAESEVAGTVAATRSTDKPDLADRLEANATNEAAPSAPESSESEVAEETTAAAEANAADGSADVASSPGGLEYMVDGAEPAETQTEVEGSDSDAVVSAADETAAAETAAAERSEAEAERQKERARLEAERERRRLLDARRAEADAKFEQQKERAGDILDELRGELGLED